jgi:hypothetical protein
MSGIAVEQAAISGRKDRAETRYAATVNDCNSVFMIRRTANIASRHCRDLRPPMLIINRGLMIRRSAVLCFTIARFRENVPVGSEAEKRVDANYGDRSGGVSLAQILLIADRARSPHSPVA